MGLAGSTKAGLCPAARPKSVWIPAFAGMTGCVGNAAPPFGTVLYDTVILANAGIHCRFQEAPRPVTQSPKFNVKMDSRLRGNDDGG
ncbi:hypothetical protein GCM10007418_33460 [Halopseudomonas salina]|uniref:Uncharacterized protein n=1 Tax=Halopseudomonas salina TaxID=1323744 RepID=A0ABQ1Q465_9GAMM|nr:hypothetical protein GCM10007418_33460 [Halopseudomonas salina]